MFKSWLVPALLTITLLLLMVVTMAIIGDVQGGFTPATAYILYSFYILILLSTLWWVAASVCKIIVFIKSRTKKPLKSAKR